MKIYLTGFQPDMARKTLSISRFVSTVPMMVIAAWLFTGGASVASARTTTEFPGAIAVRPCSDVTQIFPAALTARPEAEVAAIDEDEDGDDDQADPDDPNDTLAAADAFWWGAADATLRASLVERERQPRLEAFASQVAEAA